MSVQVKGSGTIGGLDEGLVVSGIVTSSTQINVGSNIKIGNAGVGTFSSINSSTSPNFIIKDGTTEKGYIGFNGNDPFMGRKNGVGLLFQNNKIRPVDGDDGSGSNNTVDIGENTYKFKDAYFSGTVTANSYAGDGSNLTGITGTTINNNANNRVITGSGSANTLEGESSFTYDGNGHAYITGTGAAGLTIQSPDTTDTGVYFSDGANSGAISYLHTNNSMKFRVNGQNRVQIGYNGNLDVLYDNAPVSIGDGQDLKLYHDGSNSYIDNATNILWIRNQTTGSSTYMRSDEILLQSYTDNPNENYIVAVRGADVKLYHNGTHMFQTTSTGVNVQSSGSSHGLTVTHSNGNVVASLHNKGSGDEGYLALRNGGTDTIKLDGEHGRLEGTETKTLNTPRVLISVNLATNANHSAYGVQTVYHYGSGVFQVVFAANMPNDNYVTTASAVGSVNGDGMVVAGIGGATDYRTVGDLRMRVSYCTNNAGNDVTNVNLAFFTNA